MIICQKSGLSVWKWHLEDQGVDPSRIFVIDPKNRAAFDAELEAGAHNHDYFLVHYPAIILLQNLTGLKGARRIKWNRLILDEVHLIKNRKSKRTVEIKRIKAEVKRGLSGTPADDKPQDFWSVLNWIYPGEYSSYWRFYDRYLDWETHPYNGYRVVKGVKNLDEFHRKIGPYYIRRTLFEVRGDMPEKTRGEIRVEMTPRQRRDYDSMFKYQVAQVGELREQLVVTYKIAMYVRLQQMTLGTVDLDWDRFTRWHQRYGHLCEHERPKNEPNGPDISIGDPSPKFDAVMEKVEECMEEGESLVVFSQFKAVVEGIAARCRKAKIPVSTFSGADPNQSRRDQSVADFQAGKTRVFCGTIEAAGTTITLTRANQLIFTDRHWNPSKNEQAEDRIWRINQPNACRIWDIVMDDTIDDERLRRIWEKAQWVNEVVNVPAHLKDLVV